MRRRFLSSIEAVAFVGCFVCIFVQPPVWVMLIFVALGITGSLIDFAKPRFLSGVCLV